MPPRSRTTSKSARHFERPLVFIPTTSVRTTVWRKSLMPRAIWKRPRLNWRKPPNFPEANANAALIAVREHRLDQAEALLGKALSAANYNEVLGNLLVARGNFVQAAQTLKGLNTNTAALRADPDQRLCGGAPNADGCSNRDAMTAYLSAVVGARTGDVKGAAQALAGAIAADRSLAGLAQTDLELAKVLAAHPELVK